MRPVHYLVWQRFRMACGRTPESVYTSASFWELVTCVDCLAARDQLGQPVDDLADRPLFRTGSGMSRTLARLV